ncbi:MAG: hypothetical protein Lokiarch_03720 [Candidatus Lokiarchaeum sp. GC14_75]|nr:MAG: hypothetical protein Lokiarch_03720 [Candidatus Lokiarchaeum sp. GC14_75]
MSTFYFKTLILGDPDTIHFFVASAFNEPGEDKDTYFSWYKEVKVVENTCDLEIDAITSISADLDEIIQMVDGIIYFVNPLIKEEFELLEMVIPDIFSAKHDIPLIIIFYDQNGIIPVSVNDLLTKVWVNYPSLEAFVNLNPKEFHQVLQALCMAMISGETPLNIENAWMRFPIFIQMANVYYDNKNYFYAAQAVRKAALIAEIYKKEEYFIFSEQAAYLFSKINLYLEASNILNDIDKQKSRNFKKLYAEAIIREGNLSFNNQEFEKAASFYERAGQWASIELLEKEIIDEAFKLAITSWVSACKVEYAFRILENLPRMESIYLLKEVLVKIKAASEFLANSKRYNLAKEQLYLAINKYQSLTLFDELKELTTKLTEILIQIFKTQTSENELYAAKSTFDEIENMWESYDVERTDLDGTLKVLITSFLDKYNFGMATILINKLNFLVLKQDLTKLSAEVEDKFKAIKKKEIEENIKKGVKILSEFVKAELDIIVGMNNKKIHETEELMKQKKYLKGAKNLQEQAKFLKKIGKEDIMNRILIKSLDVLLEGYLYEEFFITFNDLSKDNKKRYLKEIFPIYLDKLKDINKLENYQRIDRVLESSNRVYRKQELYDESKEISFIFIENIKTEAIKTLQIEETLFGIKKANKLLKKARTISSAYLEKEDQISINFDRIYKEMAEISINEENLPSALKYNDKIEDRAIKSEIHKKIDKLEAEKSAIRTQRVDKAREGEELNERLSIIENRGREASGDRDIEFKRRKAYKRAYFNTALSHITNREFGEAIDIYKETITQLNKSQKYNLAGVSLAVISLLLIHENRLQEIKQILEETIGNLAGKLGRLFSGTFAVTLVEYNLQLKKFQEETKFEKALNFYKNLPLFEEELNLLRSLLGEEIAEVETGEKLTREEVGRLSRLSIELDQNFGKLQSEMEGEEAEKENLFRKRKAMKRRFYKPILDLLKLHKFKESATKYNELTKTFSKRGDFRSGSFLMLLHGLCSLKANEPYTLIIKNLDLYLNSLGRNKKLVSDTYNIRLIQVLINVKMNSLEQYLPKIKSMLEVLPLFEEEKQLLDLESK